MQKRLIWIVLGIVGAGAVLLAAHLLRNEPGVGQKLGLELAKFLIQVALVVLFGGIAMGEYNARRDRKLTRNEFRKTFLRRLMQVYLRTKHARLLLRARIDGTLDADGDTRLLPWEPYEKQMVCIGDSKTEVEMLRRELEFFPAVFDEEHRPQLKAHLKAIEEYLKQLLTEYRDEAGKARDAQGCLQLSQLPRLSSFARGTKEGSTFRETFADPMYAATRIIQAERLTI